jgi:hypothetical protein
MPAGAGATIRAMTLTGDGSDKIAEGDACPRCGMGKLAFIERIPMKRRPGMSEARFRCSSCFAALHQVEDNRFQD